MRTASAFVFFTLAVPSVHAQTYFPPDILGRTPQTSEVAANRYSKFLSSLHEPSLLELAQHDPNAEVYRLLWLREFDRPASIRFVRKPGGTGWFYRHMTSGTGGTQAGRMSDNGMSWSWKSRTASFLTTVERAGFWSLPTLTAENVNAVQACRSPLARHSVRRCRVWIACAFASSATALQMRAPSTRALISHLSGAFP